MQPVLPWNIGGILPYPASESGKGLDRYYQQSSDHHSSDMAFRVCYESGYTHGGAFAER